MDNMQLLHDDDQRLDGLVAVNRVTVLVVVVLLFGKAAADAELEEEETVMALVESFLALEVVGFIKPLKLAPGVVLLALTGLEGVKVAEDVILMGLERMFGFDAVDFITLKPFLVKSC